MEDVTQFSCSKIRDLLKRFALKAYSSKLHDEEDEKIIELCIELWKLDYTCEILENANGMLCSTYPSKIIIPTHELGPEGSIVFSSPLSRAVSKAIASETKKELSESEVENKEKVYNYLDIAFLPAAAPSFSGIGKSSKEDEDGDKIGGDAKAASSHKFNFKEYLNIANRARCRYRFPVPSILCKGKYVNRSATLSCLIDVLGKKILHSIDSSPDTQDDSKPKHSNDLDKARFYDIKLLEALGTTSIMDLMVENKKIKYSVPVSSSEKADRENRYFRFNINSIPYPGCEFFSEFSNQNFNSSNLYYNWDSHMNDTKLSLTEEKISAKVTTEWNNYKDWDLRTMTENYLKLIQKYIVDDDSKETGFLIHCISGWDRTPLFISLLRLSLWAEGLVHCSLNAKQMLFLTLAYDWYLFGHQLPERLKANENILYFCFEFLEVISSETFSESAEKKRERHPSNGSTASAYDSATDGIETPLSSFGSTTSLASSSSNPPSSTHSGPNLKVSPSRQPSSIESCVWPFNKENGFTFEGISDNESSQGLAPDADSAVGNVSFSPRNLPSRSPLKERNKGSPKSAASSSSSIKSVSGGRKNLNGMIRDLAGKRTRKTSTTDPQSSKLSGGEGIDLGGEGDGATSITHGQEASNPVPVPGVRSRHNSSSSSIGSWQMVSTSDALNDSFSGCSLEMHRSRPLNTDMVDSTSTIKEEEYSPSSSLDSSHSFIIFHRKQRLTEIKNMFIRIYKREISSLHSEGSFLSGIVNNFYHKLGT